MSVRAPLVGSGLPTAEDRQLTRLESLALVNLFEPMRLETFKEAIRAGVVQAVPQDGPQHFLQSHILGWCWDRRRAAEARAAETMRQTLHLRWPPGRPRHPRPNDPAPPSAPSAAPWTGDYLVRSAAGALARTIHPRSSDEYVKLAGYDGGIRTLKVAPKLILYYKPDVIAWAQGRIDRDRARGDAKAKAETNGHAPGSPVVGKRSKARRPR